MKLCPECGSPEHPKWKAHVFVNTKALEKPSVNTIKKLIEKPVNTNESNGAKFKDRHQAGYMRMYMAVVRAVKAGRACRWPK